MLKLKVVTFQTELQMTIDQKRCLQHTPPGVILREH